MLNNPSFESTLSAIKLFANTAANLNAIVMKYNGSEFCSGLLFGIHGSNLLIGIAKMILMQSDAARELAKQTS